MSGFSNSGTPYGGTIGNILGDLSGVQKHAKHHGGSSSDDGIFGQALNMLSAKQSQLAEEDVDEGHAVKAHKKYYSGDSDGGSATSSGMGAAAAMQALKMFNGGSSGGSSSQQEFIGMAMGQASKLFDSQASSGNVADGESKESAVQQAGEMALKMYMKSEMGGGSSGGSGLMGLASKFM
jgi:hypothetical protein